MKHTLTLLALFTCLVGCLEERTDEPAPDAEGSDAAGVIDIIAADTSTADAGAQPDPSLLALGAACVASSECTSGNCALPCAGYGNCAPGKCAVDGDCDTPGANVHCCVAGACQAIVGSTCGARAGQQGASCAGAGQTGCAEGLSCLSACMAEAFCAATCTDNAQCKAKDSQLACFKTVAHGKRCVGDPDPAPSDLCELNSGCSGGSICGLAQAFDGSKVFKICKKAVGPGGVGTSCKAAGHCAIGQCFNDFCSQACTKDDDCACAGDPKCVRDQICLDIFFNLGGGSTPSTKLCYPLSRCESSADCSGSKTCSPHPQSKGWATICRKTTSATAKIAGAPCTEDEGCKSAVCHDEKCRDLCATDKHCSGGACKQIELKGPVPAGSKVGACL